MKSSSLSPQMHPPAFQYFKDANRTRCKSIAKKCKSHQILKIDHKNCMWTSNNHHHTKCTQTSFSKNCKLITNEIIITITPNAPTSIQYFKNANRTRCESIIKMQMNLKSSSPSHKMHAPAFQFFKHANQSQKWASGPITIFWMLQNHKSIRNQEGNLQ